MAYLVVGLGNPSPTYDVTRHNLGRAAVSTFLHAAKLNDSRNVNVPDYNGLLVRGTFNDHDVVISPDLGTYMNESGKAVTQLLTFLKISTDELLIVHDELALPLGKLRLDRDISSAGHNGVQSIIDALGTQSFIRLRLGIESRTEPPIPGEDFVLQRFPASEQLIIKDTLNRAADAISTIISHGLERAMNEFNR